MTIESNISKVSFVGNGVSNTLSVTYPYINKTDIKVYKEVGGSSVLMELNTDYTLQDLKNANGEITGGTITFTVTPEDGLKIIAIREVPYTQEVDYRENDIFPAETLEDALDKVTMLVQQVKETADRSVSVGIFSDSDPSEIVGEIEALYDIKDSVVTAANISSDIVTCSNNIDAIKDAENNANDAKNSKIEAQNSAVTAQLMATQAQEWAIKTDGKVDGTNYSSKYYAGQASTSAQAAQNALNEVQGLIATPIGTIFQSIYVDESLDIARRLNGQLISSTKFTGFRTWLNDVRTAFPSLFTTETNWQSEKSLSKLGQCGKFVIDDTAGTIRLPCVVNAQGLTDLALIGGIKSESLPNISGRTSAVATLIGTGEAQGALYDADGVVSGVGVPNGTTYGGIRWYLDASRSSSTYQDNAPVQQEAVQYPYYIQVATGVEETLPAIREYNINTPFFFGQSMYSDVAPDNASWLVSNGQWNAKSVYPDYYEWLLKIYNGTEVVAGVSVKLSTDTYDDYDWVVNTADETFRLPLLDGSEDLPSDRFEDWRSYVTGTEVNLPEAPANGYVTFAGNDVATTGYLYVNNNELNSGSGQTTSSSFRRDWVQVKKGDVVHLYINNISGVSALRFNYAKGNGSLYYYVGDTVQDASLINAGAVLGQLANKADANLSNLDATGQAKFDAKANVDLSNLNNTGNAAASNLNSKGIRTVIETYVNGTSWYRIWSDGWIEQGGRILLQASTYADVTLLKPFTDTNYMISFSHSLSGTGGQAESYATQASVSYIRLGNSCGNEQYFAWSACGY